MKANAPKKNIYLAATIVGWAGAAAGTLGVLGVTIPVITPYAFWLAAGGFVLLWLGCTLKGW